MYRRFIVLLVNALLIWRCAGVAPAGPWDAFNYAPSSRTVYPKTIYSVSGHVQNAHNLVANLNKTATLNGNGSYVVLDFSKEVRTSHHPRCVNLT
jgi:hypothetical protein